MNRPYHSTTPLIPGSLHSLAHERDNCGMGAIAQIHGKRSHEVLDYALTSVCNMTHRGAVDADMKTGDGSGILSQIPHPIFRRVVKELGGSIGSDDELAVGVFFLPDSDAGACQQIKELAVSTVKARGIGIIGWREVPVDPDALGKLARRTQPVIEQLLMKRPDGWDGDHFERQLFLCRRRIEIETTGIPDFYRPSFSSRLISYKGLAMPAALRAFYKDLQDSDFETAIALYHQRFSTNTFPAWPLGQPFRMMCHNGEINTVEGNRNWLASREDYFESEIWGEDIELLRNLVRSNTRCACWRRPPSPTMRRFPRTSGASISSSVRSRSRGTARRDWSIPMASSSAPRSTATACVRPATSSPRMACSTSARRPARW